MVTLITNIFLGIMLYNALNRPTTYGATQSLTSTTSTVPTSSSGSTGYFSYNYVITFDIKMEGKYIIMANFAYPNEVVVIYLPNGETVTLTAESPFATVHLHKGHIELTVLVSGQYYGNEPGEEEILNSLNLTLVPEEDEN